MKRFRDLKVSSPVLDQTAIADYIESFAKSADGWILPMKQNAEYRSICNAPACCLVYVRGDLPKAAVHLIGGESEKLHIANIVPLECSALTRIEYNGIASIFARELRAKAKQDGVAIKFVQSKADIGLRDVVRGDATWKAFSRYLSAFPLSHHAMDVERLDRFICTLSRYSRRSFDADAFQWLLQEELGWRQEEAENCRRRVEIGLEVLAVHKRF